MRCKPDWQGEMWDLAFLANQQKKQGIARRSPAVVSNARAAIKITPLRDRHRERVDERQPTRQVQ